MAVPLSVDGSEFEYVAVELSVSEGVKRSVCDGVSLGEFDLLCDTCCENVLELDLREETLSDPTLVEGVMIPDNEGESETLCERLGEVVRVFELVAEVLVVAVVLLDEVCSRLLVTDFDVLRTSEELIELESDLVGDQGRR